MWWGWEMSKKLICIRIIIVFICLVFLCLFIFLFSSIQQSVNMDTNIEETTVEEKIVFDIRKPPNKQRIKIINHKKEYLDQVYDYIFNDKKFANCLGYDYLSAYDIVDGFKSLDSLVYLLKGAAIHELMKKLFSYELGKDGITFDDLPVTDKYKEKHPKPLYEEFDFIKKEDYKSKKKYYSEYTNSDYWYEFIYDYGIGVDENNKIVCVEEEKYVYKTYRDRETEEEHTGTIFDKDGNEVPAYVETRSFYFKYMTDEKGYVDDIVYDRTEVITDDKYLDNLIKYE